VSVLLPVMVELRRVGDRAPTRTRVSRRVAVVRPGNGPAARDRTLQVDLAVPAFSVASVVSATVPV
jgi:hypothetical protein